ncbi:MAG: arylsulfatase [Bryobacteraceae bacterium]|nr:arylsulfatase [Bryobacteraceae bacterium]
MNRREFIGGLSGAMLAGAQTRAAKKPNFVAILADDMGYSDAGCYGGEVATPNLDGLAAKGVRFTQMYSTARCGPSRGSLLTGYYAQRTASDVMTPGNIPEWTRFIPHYLKPLGYRSYHAGKWHIRFRPVAGAGFDHSYSLNDQERHFSPTRHQRDDKPLPEVKRTDGFYGPTATVGSAVDHLKRHAAENATDPFFLYLAFTVPHFPLMAPQEDIDEYQGKFTEGWDTMRERKHARMKKMGLINCDLPKLEPDVRPGWILSEEELRTRIGPGEVGRAVPWSTLTPEQKEFQRTKMAIHAAMITRMDKEVGRVVDQLKSMNALDNTVIIFLSDNGASSEQMIRADGHDKAAPLGSAGSHICLGPGWSSASNTPFRLHKSWVHEGGIASPLIVHWPAGVKDAGKLRHDPCHFVDVLPTLLDLAGGDPNKLRAAGSPALSGTSLVPAFTRDNSVKRTDPLYFNHSNNRALREGNRKIVAIGTDGPWELYDLGTDRAESKNLAAKEPQVVQQMAAKWKAMDDEYVKVREAAKPMPRERI